MCVPKPSVYCSPHGRGRPRFHACHPFRLRAPPGPDPTTNFSRAPQRLAQHGSSVLVGTKPGQSREGAVEGSRGSHADRWGRLILKLIQTGGDRPRTAGVERGLLDGEAAAEGNEVSAPAGGAAPPTPTAASQPLFGGRATGRTEPSPGPSLPQTGCQRHVLFPTAGPLPSPCWVASLARDPARPMGSGYPKGLGARPQGAGPGGGGRGSGARRSALALSPRRTAPRLGRIS